MAGKLFPTRRFAGSALAGGLRLQTGGRNKIVITEDGVAELEVRDAETGTPLPGLAYLMTLPDGSTRSGVLDRHGRARAPGVPIGAASVRFFIAPSNTAPHFQPSTRRKP